ncbi:MAG TPA: A24 family peptidase [Candidatus Limnocylindrales bacterium]|nr:A24 family peptidase [Candidatus Limnocylindrales bacterium]
MTPLALATAAVFTLIGAAAERLASVWPPDEASRRGLGWRTLLLAAAAAAAAWAIAARSTLPLWATLVYLLMLAFLVVLAATDLEQRRLPHLVLDPLILFALAFVPFNPSVAPLNALLGAAAAVGFLGLLGLIIRAGVALGDLYLVAPLGLLLGWPAIFLAVFFAALISSITSLALLATRRVGLKSYIPFGPFLVAGAVLALLRDERLLGDAAAAAAAAAAARLTWP